MRESMLKGLLLVFMVVLVHRVKCQGYPKPFLECYLERDVERDLLKFDLGVYRNQVPFNDVYFVNQTRHHLINGECPAFSGNPSAAVNEDFFRTTFYVDPSTNLITDGSECGIEVIESGKEYQFRVETKIEFERDRKGDIQFIYNCHVDWAARDIVKTVLEIQLPDLVPLYPPVEVLQLRAVTVTGGALPTITLDGSVIPTIDIGNYFALQLEFETTGNSSATGATCDKLYVSVDETYSTRTEDIIHPDTHCPANSAYNFMRPNTGLKRIPTSAANTYWYRTGAIQASKYYKVHVPEATDILYFACEAKFCRDADTTPCDDPCPARRKREVKLLERGEFKKLVKRNSDKMVTVKIKIESEETAAKPQGNSMVIVWSLVGVGCATLAILTCCLVAFCRVRRKKFGRKNAYRHHIDASSITSSVGKDKHLEQRSEPVSVVKIHH